MANRLEAPMDEEAQDGCKDTLEHLAAYHLRIVTTAVNTRVTEHLAVCRKCRAKLDALKDAISIYLDQESTPPEPPIERN